jgi:zinc ribbon protein
MTACSTCGAANPADAKFCSNCGSSLAVPAPADEVRKTVTILFCDVTGSTQLGEQLDPASLRKVNGEVLRDDARGDRAPSTPTQTSIRIPLPAHEPDDLPCQELRVHHMREMPLAFEDGDLAVRQSRVDGVNRRANVWGTLAPEEEEHRPIDLRHAFGSK